MWHGPTSVCGLQALSWMLTPAFFEHASRFKIAGNPLSLTATMLKIDGLDSSCPKNTLLLWQLYWHITGLAIIPLSSELVVMRQHRVIMTPLHLVCIAGVLAYQQVQEITIGREMHQLGAFAKGNCKCKSKSNIITNAPLGTGPIHRVEVSGFGVQAICPKAPSLGLALVGRYEFNANGDFTRAEPLQGLDNFNSGPFRKLSDRLKSFYRPTLSITARCTGFNTFILSVMPYTISYFGLTTADLNRLRQAAARFILKRHWLEAEILPYVLRYFGIATLLDPAVSATIAATFVKTTQSKI